MIRIFRYSVIDLTLILAFFMPALQAGSDSPYPRTVTAPVRLGSLPPGDVTDSSGATDVAATLKPGNSKTFDVQYSFDAAIAPKIQIVRGSSSLPDFIAFDIDAAEWVSDSTVRVTYRLTAAATAPEGLYNGIILWEFLDFSMAVVATRQLTVEVKVSEADVFVTLMPGELKTFIVQYSFDAATASQLRAVRAVLSFPSFVSFAFNAGDFVGSQTVAIQYRLTAAANAPGGVYRASLVFEFLDALSYVVATREIKFEITIDRPPAPDDHGDSCTSATDILAGENRSGSIGAGGDLDFFRIALPTAGTLTAYTTGPTNVLGTLHGSTCTPLASDDNSGTGDNFWLARAVEAGTYYISVRHASTNGSGSYILFVEFEPEQLFEYELFFPHIANGGGITSQLSLLSLSATTETSALILIRDDLGEPLSLGLSAQDGGPGEYPVTVPASGLVSLKTDGMGSPVAGAVTVRSDRPLVGVVVFGGNFGLAGVDSSPAVNTGVLVPVEMNQATGTRTGIALQNLEDHAVSLLPTFLDPSGNLLATAVPVGLAARGHRALFPDQLVWSPSLDFADLRGVLKVSTLDGSFAATVLLTRPGQLASLPAGVVPGPQ